MNNLQKVLKSLKKVWALSLCVCLGCIVNTPIAHAADDDRPDTVQYLEYSVYAGGIHAVDADLTIDYSKDGKYGLVLNAKTYGILGRLAPWEGSFESYGWLDGADRLPELHRSIAIWRGEVETKSYNYAKDGGFQSLMIKDHDKPERKEDVAQEVTQGTTDALTAALLVLEHVHQGGKCEGRSDVFDGKRRFAQIFKEVSETTLKSSRYNIYEGKAKECTVEIEPIAGKWHSKPRGWLSIQEQGRERGTMPTVWIGTMNEDGPALPVKIRVKTAYGTLFMHLTKYISGPDRSILPAVQK